MPPDTTLDRPVLTTERLVLRRPERRDLPAIVAVMSDREVALRLSRIPHPYGIDDALFFLDKVVPAEWCWTISQVGDDTLIGVVGLTPDAAPGAAELGYWLSPAQWSRGIATEAASTVLAHGIRALGLTDIHSGFFASNPASGRVLAKLGFVETGRAMRPCLALGHEVPSVEMRLPIDPTAP